MIRNTIFSSSEIVGLACSQLSSTELESALRNPNRSFKLGCTDPESRIMKNSNNAGFEQSDNAQVAVDQERLLIVAPTLSNHPTDRQEALPTVDAIPPELGTPQAATLDNGYFSPNNIAGLEARGIDPYIATGRDPHHSSWTHFFDENPEPPADASPKVKMAHKLKTDIGQAIYRLRKSTVEPVIGIIKEVIGFRQLSLRGLDKAAGEWTSSVWPSISSACIPCAYEPPWLPRAHKWACRLDFPRFHC